MSDGQNFVVTHPEQAFVSRYFIVVGVAQPHEIGGVYERVVNLAVLHITQLEQLPTPAARE